VTSSSSNLNSFAFFMVGRLVKTLKKVYIISID